MASPRPIIRQLVFFLLAVMLPSAVLLSFGVVLLRQETELNERRLEEPRATFFSIPSVCSLPAPTDLRSRS